MVAGSEHLTIIEFCLRRQVNPNIVSKEGEEDRYIIHVSILSGRNAQIWAARKERRIDTLYMYQLSLGGTLKYGQHGRRGG